MKRILESKSNSAKRSPECRSLERHSLSFSGRVNSAKRFPELSVSLLGSLDRSRLKLNTTLSMDRVVE
ncbi:hypothetical protein MAL08_17265 [Leptospira noguchii]|uniref:hypothetical protein n=1 Tax=Leptospira noguchii TaxID=28182 RepID=UPI001FB7BE0A|nr:hypothetical protein [Leptospira noguchii]UOG37734.1 hypothetical protein MAL08_17265 [Leptospira noguchii]